MATYEQAVLDHLETSTLYSVYRAACKRKIRLCGLHVLRKVSEVMSGS